MPGQVPGSASISDANKATMLANVQQMIALMPFLISLTDEERKRLSKLGDKTSGFDLKCRDYMEQNPALVPGFVNMQDFGNFCTLLAQMNEIGRDFVPVSQAFDDTVIQVGHQIYSAELAFYQNVVQAAKRNVPGAQAIYDDLKVRFPGGSSPAAPASATTTTTPH